MRRVVLLLVVLLACGYAIGAIPAPVSHFGFDVYDGKIRDSISVNADLNLPVFADEKLPVSRL